MAIGARFLHYFFGGSRIHFNSKKLHVLEKVKGIFGRAEAYLKFN